MHHTAMGRASRQAVEVHQEHPQLHSGEADSIVLLPEDNALTDSGQCLSWQRALHYRYHVFCHRSPSTCPESQLALKSRRDAFIQMDISVPLTICMDSLSADVRNRALTAICSLDVPESDNSE